MSKPKSYIEQEGCHSCEHCFCMVTCDDGNVYFCDIEGEDRPPCGSVAMDEDFCRGKSMDEIGAALDAWDTWENGKLVIAWGRCNEWLAYAHTVVRSHVRQKERE